MKPDVALNLVGWRSAAGHGFALPIYGSGNGANTLYVAACSVPGDHQGTISAFEPLEVDNYERWTSADRCPVKVGDPWQNVFVWDGKAYAGSASKLWSRLSHLAGVIGAKAPISLFQLALNANAADARSIGPVAFKYVRDRFGRDRALHWRREFLRVTLITMLRRAISSVELRKSAIEGVAIQELIDHDLIASIVPGIREDLTGGALQAVIGELAETASFLGAAVRLAPTLPLVPTIERELERKDALPESTDGLTRADWIEISKRVHAVVTVFLSRSKTVSALLSAEDLTQEVMVALIQFQERRGAVMTRDEALKMSLMLARHQVIDRIRMYRRRAMHLRDDEVEVAPQWLKGTPGISPEQAAIVLDWVRRLEDRVGMSPTYRNIFEALEQLLKDGGEPDGKSIDTLAGTTAADRRRFAELARFISDERN